VRSSMLHGSETWPVRKENEVALQRAELRIVRWMCGVKLQDRIPSEGSRERLRLDDIISVLQQNKCDGMGMYCKKKTMIWCRNVWSMKFRVPDREVDQRKVGQRLWKKARKLNR